MLKMARHLGVLQAGLLGRLHEDVEITDVEPVAVVIAEHNLVDL